MASYSTPSLKALRSFEAAARLRSLTLAASELNVTVSAVAFQVRQVEEALGSPLLRRSGRGVDLSPEGLRLATAIAPGFAAIDAALESFRSASVASTRVTVSTLSSTASLWLLPRLAEFRSARPDIDVRIVTSQAHADFAAGEADCAIRCGEGGWPGLSAEALFPQSLGPICHRSHPAARTRELPPDAGLIVNSERQSEWIEWFRRCGLTRAEPDEGQRFYGRELVADAVYGGLGVGLMDVNLCSRDLHSGELVLIGPAAETGWTHWIVRPSSMVPSDACTAFMSWLLRQRPVEGGEDEQGAIGRPPLGIGARESAGGRRGASRTQSAG